MRLKTRIVLVLFFFAIGAGTGYAWRSNILVPSLDNPQQPEMVQKQRAVKPKNLKTMLKDVVPAPKVDHDFTFFDTLNDVDQGRFVDLDGTLIEKNRPQGHEERAEKTDAGPKTDAHAPVMLAENTKTLEDKIKELEALLGEEPQAEDVEASGFEQVETPEVEPGEMPTVEPVETSGFDQMETPSPSMNEMASSEVSTGPRYQVQVSSFRDVKRARALENRLLQKGYDAFYTPVSIPGKGVWYRVFLGEFARKVRAQEIASRARQQDDLQTMILTVR